jgi:hypothetical protein
MSQTKYEIVTSGKYKFKIYENILSYEGKIFSRNFKIGGDYDDCVNLSYTYSNGLPISAKLPHLMYEPECAVDMILQRGEGSIQLIKKLLYYAYEKINQVYLFEFEDMSSIDCIEKDLSKLPPRKQIKPLNLAYLSIAYNGMTWYEKNFNAKMIDKNKYEKYKERLSFLTKESDKVNFERFLEIAKPPIEQINIIKPLYDSSNTYRDFFNKIPFNDRCNILFPWLSNFILFYIDDVYNEKGWVININEMDIKIGGNKINKRRKTRRLFPSKYRLIHYENKQNF